MNDLNITVRQFRDLVTPVLPLAGSDGFMPVLAAVFIESRGPWLTATATDRMRAGIKRLRCPEGDWPEFAALLPVTTVKGILSAFKPCRRDSDPQLTLTKAGGSLKVKGDGALLDMLGAEIEYEVLTQEFPPIGRLIAKAASATPEATSVAALDFGYMADFAKANRHLTFRINSRSTPAFVTDGADFIGVIMPRKLGAIDSDGVLSLPEGWDALLAKSEPKSEPTAPESEVGAA